MTVPKEIAEKAARYEKLVNEANELFKELDEWVNENGFDGIYAHSFGVSKEVHGEEQLDGEWCDQIMIGEDSGDGTYYYPIEGSNMYMYVKYSF